MSENRDVRLSEQLEKMTAVKRGGFTAVNYVMIWVSMIWLTYKLVAVPQDRVYTGIRIAAFAVVALLFGLHGKFGFTWKRYLRCNVRGYSIYFWITRSENGLEYAMSCPDQVSSRGFIWKYPLGGWFNRGPQLLEWRSDAYCVYGLHKAKTDWRLIHPKSSAVPVQYGKPEVIKVLLGTKDGTMALMWLPDALRWMADNPSGDFDNLFESWKVNCQSREFLQQLIEGVLAQIEDTTRFRMTKEAGELVQFIDGKLRDVFPEYRARREREEALRPRTGGHGIKA